MNLSEHGTLHLLRTLEAGFEEDYQAAVNSGTSVTGVGYSSSVTCLPNQSISYVYQEVAVA